MSLAKKICWTLVAITATLLVLHLSFQWLNLHFDQKQGQIYEISNRVDFDDEISLPTWFSQFLLLGVTVPALIAASFETTKRRRRAWRVVGVIALLFAIDEVGGLHEFILQFAHILYYGDIVPTAALNAWWVMMPFIAIASIWLIWWLSRTLPIRTIKWFMLAGVVFLAGAAGFELFSNDISKATFMYQGVMTGIEESLEMLGTILAIYAVVDYLERNQATKLTALRKALAGKH